MGGFLKSKSVDLRNFEELAFHYHNQFILLKKYVMYLNWPSTYTIWISNCENILHLTWEAIRILQNGLEMTIIILRRNLLRLLVLIKNDKNK